MPRWTGLWIVLAAMAGCSLFGPHSTSSSTEGVAPPADLPASTAAPSISARGRADVLASPDLPAPASAGTAPPAAPAVTGPAGEATMSDPLGPLAKPQFLARSLEPVDRDPTTDTHPNNPPAPTTGPAAHGAPEPGTDTTRPASHDTAAAAAGHDASAPATAGTCPAAGSTWPTMSTAAPVKDAAATPPAPTGAVARADATPPAQPRAQFTGGIDTAAPEAPAAATHTPEITQAVHTTPAAESPGPSVGAPPEPGTPHVTNVSTESPTVAAPVVARPAGHRPSGGATTMRVVNSKRFNLDYEVRDVGSSGVAGVELWYTRDGQTWQKHDATLHHRSPYVIEVAEEDLYGFTLVAHSGSGLSGRVPRAGDVPQVWVEVDVTRPAVRLLGVEPGTGAEAGTLDVLWQATDKNLDPRPISLSYAERPDGPWTPIATHIENTGRYVWRMPAAVPSRLLVRVEAQDRAGNVGVAQTPAPLPADVTLPTTSIRDVEAAR
jgi:hypothetical protein